MGEKLLKTAEPVTAMCNTDQVLMPHKGGSPQLAALPECWEVAAVAILMLVQ